MSSPTGQYSRSGHKDRNAQNERQGTAGRERLATKKQQSRASTVQFQTQDKSSLVKRAKPNKLESKQEKAHPTFGFSDFLPPGTHYFYFVKDGHTFCLNSNYAIEQFPGTNINMNVVNIDERDWTVDYEIK